MRSLIAALILTLVTCATAVPTASNLPDSNTKYMAFCTDGDGALSTWLMSREEALLDGRDHERTTRGHRWEVWTEDRGTTVRASVCSRIMPGTKPETMVVENACGKCVKFLVARANPDGSVNAKEFTMKPNARRTFRSVPNAKLTVDTERDCPQ